MLETVELPTGVSDLDTSLTDMDRDDFTHVEEMMNVGGGCEEERELRGGGKPVEESLLGD